MATERHSMRKLRGILRYKWSLGRGQREVTAGLGIIVGVISSIEWV